MPNKPQTNTPSRSGITYPKESAFVEFFDPPLPPQGPSAKKEKVKKHAAHPETLEAINRLCQIRLQAIKQGRSIPTKIGAMRAAGVSFKTVWRYMPKLMLKWGDKNYRPEQIE